MGNLRKKIITHPRVYIDKNTDLVPDLDYDLIYPITTYEAVHQTMDDSSTTLDQELAGIYRLIANKQDLLTSKTPGQLLTWTVVPGQIGSTEIVQSINTDNLNRSQLKVPSERAVGKAIDDRADKLTVETHIKDTSIHMTEEDRENWDAMTPLSDFNAHKDDETIHVTPEDKENWNGKADKSYVDDHINSGLNPHHVNAHQVGTYTRQEIDTFFNSLRDSFFNYKNIRYDAAENKAYIEEYEQGNFNPNYIMASGDDTDSIPENIDERQQYFALKPATDYTSNPTNNCLIYRLGPGEKAWSQIGSATMTPGDMVIRYPDTALCVWIEGRFIILFSTSSSFPNGDFDGFLWRPTLSSDGILSWTKSSELNPPEPMSIKGEPGYTPKKGVDYYDGVPGIGVPAGGKVNDIIVKTGDVNYATKWVSPAELLNSLGLDVDGSGFASIIEQTTGQNADKVMSQKAVTDELKKLQDDVSELQGTGSEEGSESVRSLLEKHVNDHENPHLVTAEAIGAVSLAEYGEHINNQDNPHVVTKAQIGLDQVNNTADINKPVSVLQQREFDAINARIDDLTNILVGDDVIVAVTWVNETCTLTFKYHDGSELNVSLPILEIFNTIYFDDDTGELVIELPNHTSHRIPIKKLLTTYQGEDTPQIQVTVENGVISAKLKPNSITGDQLASDIALPGSPTATTQLVDDNSGKLATTKFVKDVVINALDSEEAHRPLSANMGRLLNLYKTSVGDVMNILADTPMLKVVDDFFSEDPYAALSANMGHQLFIQKAPLVHTSPNSARYGRATADLFGHTRAGSADPLMDGEVYVGTDNGYYARADHRHPTDISRASWTFPDELTGRDKLLGHPKAVNPDPGSNDESIATTSWVTDALTAEFNAQFESRISSMPDETILEIVKEAASECEPSLAEAV